ncbi:hypothetical protein CALVIDRAFT_564227 [Calocera viscosa TUFC12733]|uniref:Amidohydrolase 3 domain-containing protein n=1 Tax=Calocera viscosa (strain TUFC12733) TaxID=1330018 RepID=A0A167LR67_CALVF|nr:hypothetical protein CALVIDRAFT_564227 [Calocera viscosa TUFC12733]
MVTVLHNARVVGYQALVKITCDSETCRITSIEQQSRRSFASSPWLRRPNGRDLTATVHIRRQTRDLVVIDAGGSLVLPGLVHPRLHLSQAHFGGGPEDTLDGTELLFSSRGLAFLGPTTDIESLKRTEAVLKGTMPWHEETKKVAALARIHSLVEAGRHIINSSLSHGVTSMRAQVDVDTVVGHLPLYAGSALQMEFAPQCDVRLALFASQPIYSQRDRGYLKEHTDRMMWFLQNAATRDGVRAIGSAPFMEGDHLAALRNIQYILDLAEAHGVDAEFKLDLDISQDGRLFNMLEEIHKRPAFLSDFRSPQPKHANFPLRVTIAHYGRFANMSSLQKSNIAEAVAGWEIYFVGLPDEGQAFLRRPSPSRSGTPYRGAVEIGDTVPNNWASGQNGSLVKDLDAHTSLALENAGNPTTPWDTDPLVLLTMTANISPHEPDDAWEAQAQSLLRMVTMNAAAAAGMGKRAHPQSLHLRPGDVANLVILDGCFDCRTAVTSPPFGRITIKRGRLVAGAPVKGRNGH